MPFCSSSRRRISLVASTLLSKSVIRENHPRYIGLYEGAGRRDARKYVESSDCLILLGALLTDIDLGAFTARLEQARSIYASTEKLLVRYHGYEDVTVKDSPVSGLLKADIPGGRRWRYPTHPRLSAGPRFRGGR